MKHYSKIDYSSSKSQKFIYYKSWINFVYGLQDGLIGNNRKSIFRGQSNFDQNKSNIWELKSSFNRTFNGINFLRNKYAEYGNIKRYLNLYKTSSTDSLPSTITFIDALQFFQHYAIPTPLIDFTSDPLVALYFALSSVPSYSSGYFGDKKKRYLTVTEIDLDTLEQYIDITSNDEVAKLLNHEIDSSKENYEKDLRRIKTTYEKCFKSKNYVIDFFFEPNIRINPNLFRQRGVFLYLDSKQSFEKILEDVVTENKLKPKKPFLIKHNIPYRSCFFTPENDCLNIFSYLQFKQKTGIYLFENDIQGLRYDLLNGNFTYPMDCLGKIKDCACRDNLISLNIHC